MTILRHVLCTFRRKNFEKTGNYKRAFKSNDDGVVSSQPGKRLLKEVYYLT